MTGTTSSRCSAMVSVCESRCGGASAGEPWYIRGLIDKFHDKAQAKNVRIVTACGYDSIPSDIGTYFLATYVNEKLGK